MRLDQWLWAVRLYKSRTLAVEGIRGGHVKVNGSVAKPAKNLQPGETVEVQLGPLTRTLLVVSEPTTRLPARRIPEFAKELTPPEAWVEARNATFNSPGFRARGTGRPTKRDRRKLDKLHL